jgi:hypothetical protein
MTRSKTLTKTLLPLSLAALITGTTAHAANFCIAVGGGFGGGGTSFIGKNFTVPADGNCAPWSGFTKTASTVIVFSSGNGCMSSDGKVLTVSLTSIAGNFCMAGSSSSACTDYITLCTAASGCPVGDQDVGSFAGTAKEETCSASLLKLPSSHD